MNIGQLAGSIPQDREFSQGKQSPLAHIPIELLK
jgi:hypothetical protein